MEGLLANPAVRLFGLTYLVLVLKMVAVGYATSFYRIRDKTFSTPEDYALQGLAPKVEVNPDVERARRAHQNDLENILPYFGVGLLYALTRPSPTAAWICFGGYAAARILYSIFYLRAMQPWRTVAFSVAQILLLVMLGLTAATLW